MVDINLLDDEGTPRSRPSSSEFQEPYDFEEASDEVGKTSEDESWERSGEKDASFGGYDSPRSKTLLYIAIPLVIIAIVVVIYIFWKPFFRRGGEGALTGTTTEESAEDRTGTTAGGESIAPGFGEQLPSMALAQKIETLFTSIPENAKIRSFSYNLGKFYLDVEGSGENILQGVQEGLRREFPDAEVIMRPRRTATPSTNYRALFSGVFDKQFAPAGTYGDKPLNLASFRTEITDLCTTTSLTLVNIVPSPQSTELTPVRVSVRGGITAAIDFLQQLSRDGTAHSYSKIVMNSKGRIAAQNEFDIVALIY